MTSIKYHASAHFDIDSEVEVDNPNDELDIWVAIMSDLENRYNLTVSWEKGENGCFS